MKTKADFGILSGSHQPLPKLALTKTTVLSKWSIEQDVLKCGIIKLIIKQQNKNYNK